MKKLLGISLVAVLAATPLMASAAEGDQVAKINAAAVVSSTNLATTSYVQGAYKAAADKIDAVIEDAAVTGTHNYIDAGKSVAHNLGELDTAVKANADAIAGIQSGEGSIGTRLTTAENAITTLNGDAETAGSVDYKIAAEASARDTAISGAVAALDASESQTAGDDGLALSITEVDGVITSISGSIAANTYDAHGAASAAEGRVNTTIGTMSNLNTTHKDTLVGAINEVKQAASDAYQLKANSDVATGTYAHITQGTGVAANLVSLNTAVVANDTSIATINNKQIPIVSDWSSGAVTQKKISELVTYVE